MTDSLNATADYPTNATYAYDLYDNNSLYSYDYAAAPTNSR